MKYVQLTKDVIVDIEEITSIKKDSHIYIDIRLKGVSRAVCVTFANTEKRDLAFTWFAGQLKAGRIY